MSGGRHCEYLLIEPMRLGDLDDVARIEGQSFSTPWPISAYRYELEENPNAAYFVARCRTGQLLPGSDSVARAVLVGYAGLWSLAEEAHISTIAVDPAWRGQGIGEALLARLIDYAMHRALGVVTLEVRRSNGVAQRLYSKYGFVEAGLRRRYYPDDREDALILRTPDLNDEGWRTLFESRRSELAHKVPWGRP